MFGSGICFGYRRLIFHSGLVLIITFKPLYIVEHISFLHFSLILRKGFLLRTDGQKRVLIEASPELKNRFAKKCFVVYFIASVSQLQEPVCVVAGAGVVVVFGGGLGFPFPLPFPYPEDPFPFPYP